VREQRRREDDIALLSAKITEVDKTLYSGTVRAVRELTAMQEEIASLQRRRGQLEDQVLELMEQLEPIDAAAAALDTKLDAIADQWVQQQAALDTGEQTIDDELGSVLARRAEAAQPLGAELLDEYESIRGRLGVGVARLSGNRCEGCHLTLPAVEIDRIRHEAADALVHCSECGRLLVR
jgi:predicted  nucleic acid-binding Zn-ribbon protein